MLNTYSFFHLNILFSSIEKEQRSEVIQKIHNIIEPYKGLKITNCNRGSRFNPNNN